MNLRRDELSAKKFDNQTIESLRLINCLKKSGMQIKDIKKFMK